MLFKHIAKFDNSTGQMLKKLKGYKFTYLVTWTSLAHFGDCPKDFPQNVKEKLLQTSVQNLSQNLVHRRTPMTSLVLNAAARVVTNTRKYDRGLHHTMRHELHWLDMIERVQFRIATTVYRCLHGMAPEYLSDLCFPVKQRPSSRYQLRSSHAEQSTDCSTCQAIHLWISFVCCCWTYHLEQFTWIPAWSCPELSIDNFRRQLKTFLFAQYWRRHCSALETLCLCVLKIYYLHYITLVDFVLLVSVD